jgi:hypothetical protein
MSTANAPISRRRQLLLGALTVLLHALVFRWFSHHVNHLPDAMTHAPAPMVAELVRTPPPAPPPPVPPPAPAFDPPPVPEVAPEPVPPPPAADTPATADAPALDGAVAAGPDQSGGPAGEAASASVAAAPQPAPQPVATAPAAPVPAVPAAPPQPPSVRSLHYKVDVPPSSEISLTVARTDAGGTKWSGEQSLAWTVTPSAYRIQVEAGINVLFARVNLLSLTSEGTVGVDGFAPILMTEKRRGRSMTATHFNRAEGTLTFSASQSKYPLEVGAQDKASIPLQLTAIARGDPKQLSGNMEILVGEDREAAIYTFTVIGHEQIDTPLGRLDTVHVARPPKAGAYHAQLDLWLAPARGWYPVQIRSIEQDGAVTTQTANKIVIKGAGS